MTNKQKHFIEAKAHDNVDFYYFQKLVKPNWTCTQTGDPDRFSDSDFTEYDVTVSNGTTEYYVELKGRKYELNDNILKGGCLIDRDKVEELEKFEKAYVVQFFPRSNRTFIWDVHDKTGWKYQDKITTPFELGSERKIDKDVYFMPFNPENERFIDISDYNELLKNEIDRLTNLFYSNNSQNQHA